LYTKVLGKKKNGTNGFESNGVGTITCFIRGREQLGAFSFYQRSKIQKVNINTMEDSSSDDEELISVSKHILVNSDAKVINRKRKENPSGSAQGIKSSESDNGTAVNEEIFVNCRKYKENMHFPWLELVGPTCHSVKQGKSGMDLTNVKKKYRNMRCSICSLHNPSTPWAALWPRKFELQTLVDHSKSGAHVKSEIAQEKAMPNYVHPDPSESIVQVTATTVNNTGASSSKQSNAAAAGAAGMAGNSAEVAIDGTSTEAEEAGVVDGAGAGTGNVKFRVRIRGTPGPGGVSTLSHSTRVRPPWLYSEGPLCLSDKQAADPPTAVAPKKKYKLMACLYCREFVPESQWSQLRPRKFESAVLSDHERSACHQKAVDARNSTLPPMTLEEQLAAEAALAAAGGTGAGAEAAGDLRGDGGNMSGLMGSSSSSSSAAAAAAAAAGGVLNSMVGMPAIAMDGLGGGGYSNSANVAISMAD
jgi:hypothetical protein